MHLLVAITAHGFGHAAQVAPVINSLRERLPALRVTLLSTLPGSFLEERIVGEFQRIDHEPDFGLVMHSALAIDIESSATAYADLHANWQRRVDEEARRLSALAPELVLADVPYLTLAGAAQAGIPAVALCSLNWADIYRHYFSGREEASQVLAHMEAAYQSARAFLCPQPSMPMQFLDNQVSIGPIAAQGRQRREDLVQRLGLNPEQSLVLVAPGGIETRFAIENWPEGQGIHWLVSECWQIQHSDASALEHTGLGFPDLVNSCDAVLGKCGYGTVTECVLNGTPLLYIPRPDWPEEQSLLQWLEAHGAAVELDPECLVTGKFKDIVQQANSRTITSPAATGISQAADYLYGLLS
jgi:hypothetical protein